MIAKLAWRNLRRQIGGYLLYFCALALTAALIFSATGMLFCRAVLAAGAALDGFSCGRGSSACIWRWA